MCLSEVISGAWVTSWGHVWSMGDLLVATLAGRNASPSLEVINSSLRAGHLGSNSHWLDRV